MNSIGVSAPFDKSGCIRAPLQGAGPRKGFVARQGRPFGYGGQAQERARRRTGSTPHKRATSTPDAARGSLVAAEKAAPWATGPSLPLRCASSPYSTVCLSCAPCWRGASTLSVRQAIYETVHYR